MGIITNPVFISVVVMIVLCLIKTNVLIALIVSALLGGALSGIPLGEAMDILIGGMQGNAETALSYILLGSLAAAIGRTGAAGILAAKIGDVIKDKRTILVFLIAGIACLSQNVLPVHIAFIPILIPPLIPVFNELRIDRRGIACALTFGLKAPYVMLPAGFGMIFHTTVAESVTASGLEFANTDVWKAMLIPGIGMIVGLLVAVLVTYRKPRDYEDIDVSGESQDVENLTMGKEQWGALAGGLVAFIFQLWLGSLPLGALAGLLVMIPFNSYKWDEMDEILDEGVQMMGFIAFVMLVAAGYAEVIQATGGVEDLVDASVGIIGGSKMIGAVVMLLIGLVITMGIGTSFGTVPILAAIFVPMATQLGFSPLGTVALIGTAGALGDAGSPASDSTLGPTSGLNVDGQHDHIWDTVVPTFLHFNIPLIIAGTIAAMVL